MARRSRAYRTALRQSRLAAALQTDPQAAALRLLLTQANQNFHTGVRQARGGAAILAHAADVAQPKVSGYFDTANAAIARNLGAVGAGASSNPVVAADIADTLNRLAATRAGAQSELTQRGTDAYAGANFQVENLGAQRRADVGKIGQQMLDLAGQRGKVQESTLLTLLDQAAGRAVTRRGQTLSHRDRVAGQQETKSYHQQQIDIRRGIDPVTGKRLPKGRGAGGSGLSAKDVQKNTSDAANSVAEAATWYKRLKAGGNSKQQIKDLLTAGDSIPHDRTFTDPSTGKQKVQHLEIHVPKIDRAFVNAAQDLTDFGFLTGDTVHQLRVAGVHAESIGALAPHFRSRPFKGTGRPPKQRPT